jgi:hypothetical protein
MYRISAPRRCFDAVCLVARTGAAGLVRLQTSDSAVHEILLPGVQLGTPYVSESAESSRQNCCHRLVILVHRRNFTTSQNGSMRLCELIVFVVVLCVVLIPTVSIKMISFFK